MSIRQTLSKLGKYEEAFAVELIEKSIANGWQGLIYGGTGEQYQKWLVARAKPKLQSPGKPGKDLLEHSRQSNGVYNQMVALEKQRSTFETFPKNILETLAEQLRDLWRKAKKLDMFGSEIGRITVLGQQVKTLLEV